MIGIKFEILSLMTTMHAAGLMPDEDYQIEKQRLVQELSERSGLAGPLDIESWDEFRRRGDLDDQQLFNRITNAIETESDQFEWRGVISDFLESAYYASCWIRGMNDEEILSEARRLGVQTATPFVSFGAIPLLIKEISHLRREIARTAKKLSNFESLSDEIESLKHEIEALNSGEPRVRPDANDSLEPNRSAEVDDLQRRMARCLTFAAQYDARGDSHAAGKHRGEAARIESQLRALGA